MKFFIIFLLFFSNFLFSNPTKNVLDIIQSQLILLQKNKKSIEEKDEILTLLNNLIVNVDPKEKRKIDIKEKVIEAQEEINEALKNKKTIIEPLVSFIIPCYNREKTISEAIDSIYLENMDYPFEVICCDDASTDNSSIILNEYEKKYDNFFVYKHAQNKKAPAARNTAIAHARGKYIFNLDSDDIIDLGTMNPLIKIIEKDNYDCVCPKKAVFFNDFDIKNVDTEFVQKTGIIGLEEGIHNTFLPTAGICKLFTKKSWQDVGGFKEEPGQDTWAFNFTLLASGKVCYIADEGSYFHRFWSAGTNYWHYDSNKKQLNVNPLNSIREYPELFTKESNELIKNYNLYDNSLLSSSENLQKILRLNNKFAIYCLFKAYKLEEQQDYSNAVNEYKNAIKLGCNHINVLLKLLRASIINNQYQDALDAIGMIVENKG